MTAVKIMRGARNLVASGWTQGTGKRYDVNGRTLSYCMVGAMSEANVEDALNTANWLMAMPQLAEVIEEQYPDRMGPLERRFGFSASHRYVIEFNDHPATTQDDVLAVFDKAILKEEEKV